MSIEREWTEITRLPHLAKREADPKQTRVLSKIEAQKRRACDERDTRHAEGDNYCKEPAQV